MVNDFECPCCDGFGVLVMVMDADGKVTDGFRYPGFYTLGKNERLRVCAWCGAEGQIDSHIDTHYWERLDAYDAEQLELKNQEFAKSERIIEEEIFGIELEEAYA